MNVSSEHSKSLWIDTSVYDDAPTLQSDETADVIVVGSGIAGLSTAYELAKAGKKVVVVDRGPVGNGMTSRTTAHRDRPDNRTLEPRQVALFQSDAAELPAIFGSSCGLVSEPLILINLLWPACLRLRPSRMIILLAMGQKKYYKYIFRANGRGKASCNP